MKKEKIRGKILYIVILILVAMFSSAATVFAERMIASIDVSYNTQTSGLDSDDVQGAIDELYVKCSKVPTFVNYLKSLETSDTVIKDDGTADHNMRYTGKKPNNYVTFEGEEWRVIGVFNNIDNGTGKTASRIKIIKSTSLGNKKWHTSNVNIWKNASLNKELQATLYAKSRLVANAVWYLGDPGGVYNYTAPQAYEYERGTTVAVGNDLTWTGKVGLMYPSDYGFASSACKNGSYNLDNYKNTTCTGSNWIYLGLSHEWLLQPYSGNTINARVLDSTGYVSGNGEAGTNNTYLVRPTVYLKSSVTCKNCNEATAGTKENPFQLA